MATNQGVVGSNPASRAKISVLDQRLSTAVQKAFFFSEGTLKGLWPTRRDFVVRRADSSCGGGRTAHTRPSRGHLQAQTEPCGAMQSQLSLGALRLADGCQSGATEGALAHDDLVSNQTVVMPARHSAPRRLRNAFVHRAAIKRDPPPTKTAPAMRSIHSATRGVRLNHRPMDPAKTQAGQCVDQRG